MEPPPPADAAPARTLGAVLALAALNVAVRYPSLLNAGAVHADAAVVGLQARAFLQGETARFLWGAGYQGTLDVWLAALAFRLFGDSPLTLMWVPLSGHLVATTLAFFCLLRLLRGWRPAQARAQAFLLCLPLVFTGHAVNGVVLYPPRQWAVTCVFLALALLAAPQRDFSPLRLVLGAALAVVAHYLDLLAIQFAPALVFLGLAAAFDGERTRAQVLRRVAAFAAGAALGVAVFLWLRAGPGASSAETRASFRFLARNFGLLTEALPGVLGAKVWDGYDRSLWQPLWPVRVVQWVGPAVVLALAALALPLARAASLPWPLRRAGLFGLVVMGTSVGGYLLSPRPEDLWSMRYLAPVVWVLPFALAPIAALLRPRGLAALLAPYLVSNLLGGWMAQRPLANGPWPAVDARGRHLEESRLGEVLRARGVEAAMAQFWVAYRLAFLWNDGPVMVPSALDEERRPSWRKKFDEAATVAYLYSPDYPQTPLAELEALAQARGQVERFEESGFTVLLVRRPR